jgi:hypothetical protein
MLYPMRTLVSDCPSWQATGFCEGPVQLRCAGGSCQPRSCKCGIVTDELAVRATRPCQRGPAPAWEAWRIIPGLVFQCTQTSGPSQGGAPSDACQERRVASASMRSPSCSIDRRTWSSCSASGPPRPRGGRRDRFDLKGGASAGIVRRAADARARHQSRSGRHASWLSRWVGLSLDRALDRCSFPHQAHAARINAR